MKKSTASFLPVSDSSESEKTSGDSLIGACVSGRERRRGNKNEETRKRICIANVEGAVWYKPKSQGPTCSSTGYLI